MVAHHSAHRHLNNAVLPAFSGFELSAARLAVLGPVFVDGVNALLALVLVVGVSLLRFEVSPEGIQQVGFGKRDAAPVNTMAEGSPGSAARGDTLDREQTGHCLPTW